MELLLIVWYLQLQYEILLFSFIFNRTFNFRHITLCETAEHKALFSTELQPWVWLSTLRNLLMLKLLSFVVLFCLTWKWGQLSHLPGFHNLYFAFNSQSPRCGSIPYRKGVGLLFYIGTITYQILAFGSSLKLSCSSCMKETFPLLQAPRWAVQPTQIYGLEIPDVFLMVRFTLSSLLAGCFSHLAYRCL